jgi:hypothetical protein
MPNAPTDVIGVMNLRGTVIYRSRQQAGHDQPVPAISISPAIIMPTGSSRDLTA